MGNLARTGRDDGQGRDAHSHKHTHTAVPQGQGSGNASLPSLGGDSISQHAFLMWRGNYPWAALRANRVCPLCSICILLFLPFFSVTPVTLFATLHSLSLSSVTLVLSPGSLSFNLLCCLVCFSPFLHPM